MFSLSLLWLTFDFISWFRPRVNRNNHCFSRSPSKSWSKAHMKWKGSNRFMWSTSRIHPERPKVSRNKGYVKHLTWVERHDQQCTSISPFSSFSPTEPLSFSAFSLALWSSVSMFHSPIILNLFNLDLLLGELIPFAFLCSTLTGWVLSSSSCFLSTFTLLWRSLVLVRSGLWLWLMIWISVGDW